MNYFKLIISYDGTLYAGWNPQPGKKTIFKIVHDSFLQTFSKDFHLIGASRTDAGVHAHAQVARLATSMDISSEKLLHAWNNVLPIDIQIKSVERVTQDFHPWYNVAYKVYDYYIFTKRPSPFFARYGWKYPYPFDEKKLLQALQLFQGTHDFKAFTKAQDERKNTVRTIIRIDCEFIKEYTAYRIRIVGNKFMWNMIRRMVGAALSVASENDFGPEMIEQLLKNGSPNHPLVNAPASGLVLQKIVYNDEL